MAINRELITAFNKKESYTVKTGESAILTVNPSRMSNSTSKDLSIFKKSIKPEYHDLYEEKYRPAQERFNALIEAQEWASKNNVELKISEGLHPIFGYGNIQGFLSVIQMKGHAVERPRITSLNFRADPMRLGFEIATVKLNRPVRSVIVKGMGFILRNCYSKKGAYSDAHKMNGAHTIKSINSNRDEIKFYVKNIKKNTPLISPNKNIRTTGRHKNGMNYAELHIPTSQFALLGGFDDRQQEAANTATMGATMKLNLLGFVDHSNPNHTAVGKYKKDKKNQFTSHLSNFMADSCVFVGSESRTWRGAIISRAIFNQCGFGGVTEHNYCHRGLDAQVSTQLVVTRSMIGSYGIYGIIAGDSCAVFTQQSVYANSLIGLCGTSGSHISVPASQILGCITSVYASKGVKIFLGKDTLFYDASYAVNTAMDGRVYGRPIMERVVRESRHPANVVTEHGVWFTGEDLEFEENEKD